MLTNAPTLTANSVSQQVCEHIERHEWQSAEVIIKILNANDDIAAIHRHLLTHPHPALWVAFLENAAIQTCFDQATLQSMYDYYRSLQVKRDYDLEWEVVHSLLFTLRSNIVTQQTARIANIRFNENFTDVLNELLSSKMTALWFAFINQPAILLGLRLEHYKRLIEKLSDYASTEQHENEEWITLLILYITKAYPASYQQVLSAWPQHFPIMLKFAIGEISKHCQSQELGSIPQTTKWLCFLLKLAEQQAFLTLWQQDPTFQNYFADSIKHLATIYIHQLVAIFPRQILTVLQDCKTKLAAPGPHRNVISLVKALHDDPLFQRFVLADPILCQTLGIAFVVEAPLKPTRVAPAAPQRSASLSPTFTPGYENIICPTPQNQGSSRENNIVTRLEQMTLEDEKKNTPPIRRGFN